MYLIYGKALAVKSSSQIIFFKQELDVNSGQKIWKEYYQLNIRGFLFYIKGNIRIQISTDERIFFYKVDPLTLLPILENVMFNFMGCT